MSDLLPAVPVPVADATWKQLALALTHEVLLWAREPGPHGGNPYSKGMVRLAANIKDRADA